MTPTRWLVSLAITLACGAPTPAAAQSALFPLDHFWSHAFDAPLAVAPALDETRVYVALTTGELIAIEPGMDQVAWSVDLAADGALVAAGGQLFVPAGGAVHALDAATGALQWRLPVSPLAAPLLSRAGWLFVARDDGIVHAVRARDGAVIWGLTPGAPVAAMGVDGAHLVIALSDSRVAALDVETGAARWSRRLTGPATAVTVSGDRVFAGSADGYFWSLRLSNGGLDWRWRLGARPVGAAAADDQRVYAVALDNVVRAFSRDSGNLRWSIPLPTRPLAGPQVVDGVVVITSGTIGSPGLTYLNARTGRAAGRTPPLPDRVETMRAQYPVMFSGGAAPRGLLVTAATAGGWALHGYRQTFPTYVAQPIVWGPRYEVRRRLDIRVGPPRWGVPVVLRPPAGYTPPVSTATSVRMAAARRVTPSRMRASEGDENDSRMN